MKNKKRTLRLIVNETTHELPETTVCPIKNLIDVSVDTDREILDKMLDKLEKQYGAYLDNNRGSSDEKV